MSMPFTRRFLAIVILSALPAFAGAQASLPVLTRVRINPPLAGEARTVGEVRTSTRDSAVVDLYGIPQAYGVATHTVSLDRLDVASGKLHKLKQGLAIGVVGGALLGLGIGATVGCNGDTNCGRSLGLFGGLGAALGGFLGANAGYQFTTDRWVPAREYLARENEAKRPPR
jgi:hypothetical protein